MTKKTGFYRPHERSSTAWTNDQVNPITGEITSPPSMTKQSFVAECDINNILKQFKPADIMRRLQANAGRGTYADLPDNIDFHASMNIVLQGEAAFDSLPSKLRNRFGNDPAQFLEFMADPENTAEAIKMGLATSRPVEAPKEPQAPSPAPQPAPAPDGS